jgi:uncharacterized protein involved in exopolysaccharide biosynthesis
VATVVKEREIVSDTVEAPDDLTLSRWLADTIARWRLIALGVAVMFVAVVIAVLVIPPIYRTQVSFVANTSSGSRLPTSALSAAAGPLAGLASQLGVASGADPSESPNFYIELVQSRELLTRLLLSKFRDPRGSSPSDSARLIDILRMRGSDPQRRLEKGIKKMSKAINGSFDITTNLVWLDVDARWPDLSAAIANRTIDLVSKFNQEQRVTRVRQKRVFLEDRVAKARSDLDAAEDRLRQFNEQNRSWRTAPALVFEEQHLEREMDRVAELYLTLQRQYESTLLDEVNDAARITVVDAAVTPRKALWPDYTILAVAVPMIGLFVGFLTAGTAAVHSNWHARNPRSASYLSTTVRRVKDEIANVFKRSRAPKFNG